MKNEIKEYLDSANFKFKDVDENGIETELTLSEEIEKLLEDNKKLAELCDKYEEEHNTTFKEWQKDIQANKKAIEYINGYEDLVGLTGGFVLNLKNILEENNE